MNTNTKRINVINGSVRCIVFINRKYKSQCDAIYNEFEMPAKVKLLRKLHDTCADDKIKQLVMKISLMIFYLDDEKNFLKTFNIFEEMIDMPGALNFECKLYQYK